MRSTPSTAPGPGLRRGPRVRLSLPAITDLDHLLGAPDLGELLTYLDADPLDVGELVAAVLPEDLHPPPTLGPQSGA